jgi:hypothetical protein
MKQHRFYRIINIIILPLAAYIGINVLLSIFASLTNPLLLLVSFIMVCIPLYAFTANYFYNRSIKLQQPSKPSLKDFIKVNAYVSIIFSVFMFFACLMAAAVLSNPDTMQQMLDQLEKSAPTPIPKAQLQQFMKIFVYIFLPFSVLLTIHIIIILRLLKKYDHFFTSRRNNSSE